MKTNSALFLTLNNIIFIIFFSFTNFVLLLHSRILSTLVIFVRKNIIMDYRGNSFFIE